MDERPGLDDLRVERFRGVRQARLQGFGTVNLLVGPNGCGKTTVLEAAYLLASAYAAAEPFSRSIGLRHQVFQREQVVAARRSESQPFPDEWWFRYEVDKPIAVSCRLLGQDVRVVWSSGEQPTASLPPSPALRTFFGRSLYLDASAIAAPEIERAFFDEVIKTRLDKALVSRLNDIYGLGLEDLTYSGQQRLICKFADLSFPIDSHGGGVRLAVRTLLPLLATRESLLLIEEFDAFQHKDSIARLAVAIVEVARTQRVQIIMTTHSEETVRAFATAVPPDHDDAVRFFPVVRSADGVLQARALPASTVRTLLEGGSDLRDVRAYAS